MEIATTTYPQLMNGKKILYVHGFASSGASGTVRGLRMLLPKAQIIAPDLPVRPTEALELLKRVCVEEQPDLIIGSSMGGMYTEMLRGYDRILLNPAFQIADTLLSNNKIGRQEFYNTRQDGQKDFLVTKGLIAEFREVSSQCFTEITDEERNRVWGLFGTKDSLVHTHDLFAAHYTKAVWFEGEHFMNDRVLLRSVIPVVRWIDDQQEGREHPILFIALDDTLSDNSNGWRKCSEADLQTYAGRLHDVPGFYEALEPMPAAVKAFHTLAETYDVYILSSVPSTNPSALSEKQRWVERWLGVPAYNRLIISNHKQLLYGDYLIDAHSSLGASDFMGTFLHFGEDPYKTWEDVLDFFSHLGGQ